ncbi:hypothetical protein ACFLYU_04535 [Candidatus Dependentiae bacterium]
MKIVRIFLLISCSVLFLNMSSFGKAKRNTNRSKHGLAKRKSRRGKRTLKMQYISFAVISGCVKTVKEIIESGKNIAVINKNNLRDSSTIYDALFIKNEDSRNMIVDMLLGEIKKEKYKKIREAYLNRKNYHNKKEKPASALEKAFSLGYMDISQKLIEAGADCDDSDQFDINYFYAIVKIRLLKKKLKEAQEKS